MTLFARELLCEMVQEVQPLLELHYQELTLRKDRVKLDPQWQEYALLEQLDRFIVFTAREAGELVGYNAFFLNRHLHYAGLTIAQNDVFFIAPDHRRGTTALRFLRYSEEQLRVMGTDKLVYHCKPSNNFAPILHRLEYQDEEVMAAKLL